MEITATLHQNGSELLPPTDANRFNQYSEAFCANVIDRRICEPEAKGTFYAEPSLLVIVFTPWESSDSLFLILDSPRGQLFASLV
jgi:hypothetical protein